MKTILIIKPGTISKEQIKSLLPEVVVIEHAEPDSLIWKTENPVLQSCVCMQCGERIYMTEDRHSQLKVYKKAFYCTQGHSQSYK